MKSFLLKKTFYFSIAFFFLICLAQLLLTSQIHAQSSPTISIAYINSNSDKITAIFDQSVPQGNIVDFELYNTSNQKIWQAFTTAGGTIFSETTSLLLNGSYTLRMGLFTPNWQSNYAWYNNLGQIAMPNNFVAVSPTPTPSPTPINSQAFSNAMNAYNSWRGIYVSQVGPGVSRVLRPENNNDTVSEGIGYGMLLSEFANDQTTFHSLWNYAQKYLDGNGLMHWNINASGVVIGTGGATDADEDMAYALLLASSKWSGQGYDTAAKHLINAILQHEISPENYVMPGDMWGSTTVMNPSYIAPLYYYSFAKLTSNSRWNNVQSVNTQWLSHVANTSTGLVPDWENSDYTSPNISWDTYKNAFYYDALRNPIRLLMTYKSLGDSIAQEVLQKQMNFFATVDVSHLVSGYTLSGNPLTNYLDTAFLASYTASGQVNPASPYSQEILNKLLTTVPNGYFGTSLRALVLFVIAQAS